MIEYANWAISILFSFSAVGAVIVGRFMISKMKPEPAPPEPIEAVLSRLYEARARQRTIEHQDWEQQFRKWNKGKPWDYKPTKRPLRKIVDPDGGTIHINSWQDMLDEEAICNPCARGHHQRCVVLDDELEDICFCDCTEDEY